MDVNYCNGIPEFIFRLQLLQWMRSTMFLDFQCTWNIQICTGYSSRVPSTPEAEAMDTRLDGRRGRVSSLLSLLGSMIALSSAYGRPRCRPRIYISTTNRGEKRYHKCDHDKFTYCPKLR